MPYTKSIMPLYRDADEDGLIGLRGCMRLFQDIHTLYMLSLGKGNDTLPEQYGAAWIYTRYQVRLSRKLDYSAPVALSAWVEPGKRPARVIIDATIYQNDVLAAQGRMESVVFSLTQQRPLRPQAIDFPHDLAEDIPNSIPAFRTLEKSADGMEMRYQRTVRVSDLDKSRHMINLRYIEMFQDAYDSAFWDSFQPAEMELCFLSQCKEGETLTVKSRAVGNTVHLAALHEDGTIASVAIFAR